MHLVTIQTVGSIVQLPVIRFMGKSVMGVKNATKAFLAVERILGSLRERKFYGLLFGRPESGEYFAGVQMKSEDKPEALGLEVREILTGKYARRKIRYWYKDLSIVASGFVELFKQYEFDDTRPTIEYYRSERDLHIYLPIK